LNRLDAADTLNQKDTSREIEGFLFAGRRCNPRGLLQDCNGCFDFVFQGEAFPRGGLIPLFSKGYTLF
jgi:hypothetical protein